MQFRSPYSIINIASMGHEKHGKSTVMGVLVSEHRKNNEINKLIESVNKFIVATGMHDLRYSLLFDINKKDYDWIKGFGKTINLNILNEYNQKSIGKGRTKTPWWLGLSLDERNYMIIDEPGHPQYLKHIIGATSQADIGILIVDTAVFIEEMENRYNYRKLSQEFWLESEWRKEAERPLMFRRLQQKKIGRLKEYEPLLLVPVTLYNYLMTAKLFGTKKIIICLHQMDRVDFRKSKYRKAKSYINEILSTINLHKNSYTIMPTCVLAQEGTHYNIAKTSKRIPWYDGEFLYEIISKYGNEIKPEKITDDDFLLQIDSYRLYVRQGELRPRIFGMIRQGIIKLNDSFIIQPYDISGVIRKIRLRDIDNKIYGDKPYVQGVREDGEVQTAYAGESVMLEIEGSHFDKVRKDKRIRRKTKLTGCFLCGNKETINVTNQVNTKIQLFSPWNLKGLNIVRLIYGYLSVQCQINIEESRNVHKNATIVTEKEIAISKNKNDCRQNKFIIERNQFIIGGGVFK